MRRHSSSIVPVVVTLVVVLIIAIVVGAGALSALHTNTMTCTVNDKDRTTDRDGNSEARVYTDECGVLRVGDSLLSWTWSSADTYASMKEGKTYEVTTRGYRIPFFSVFPNVVEAREK